jgi:hypothetical protein
MCHGVAAFATFICNSVDGRHYAHTVGVSSKAAAVHSLYDVNVVVPVVVSGCMHMLVSL